VGGADFDDKAVMLQLAKPAHDGLLPFKIELGCARLTP